MPRWEPDARERLWNAALALFEERGYEATTVADITARAGLTKRTFFRHFAEKREVLFSGPEDLKRLVVTELASLPRDVPPLQAAIAAFQVGAAWFEDVRAVAARRQRIIDASPELMERELLKLASLAAAIGAGLEGRGIERPEAALAAEASVTLFRVAFGRWASDAAGSKTLDRVLHETLEQMRALAAATDAPS